MARALFVRHPGPGRHEALMLGVAVVVAAILRFVRIGGEGIWLDEAVSVLLAQLPPGEVLAASQGALQAPLYPLILRLWVLLFGTSEAALRSLGAVAGTLTVPLIWWVGRRLHSRRAGMWACWLFAVSPLAVHYAQEARPYALMMPAAAASALLLVLVRGGGGPGTLVGLTAVLSALALLHHVGAILVAALVLSCFVPFPGWRAARRVVLAGAIAALLWAGWSFAGPGAVLHARVQLEYVHAEGSVIPRAARSLSSWTPGTDLPVRNRVRIVPARAWVALLACVLLGAIGILRWPKEAPRVARTILFGAPILFLLLLLLSESAGLPIWIVGRTDSAALPVALLAVAAGLTSLPAKRALLAGILLAILCVLPLAEHYVVDHRSQERLMAESLIRMTDAGDTVLVTGPWVPALRYYFGRAADPPELRTFPAGFEEGTVLPGWEASYHGEVPRDAAREVVAGLRRRGRERVWLVLDDEPAYRIIGEEIGAAYRPVSFFRAPEPLPVTIIRYQARAGSAPPLLPVPGDA